MSKLFQIFESRHKRQLRPFTPMVAKINAFEIKLQALSDQQLADKTNQFHTKLAQGHTVDAILFEAFAVVREASRRVLGMRHFDVQLLGGLVLHYGKVAEMSTGEGKTLAAPLAAYLNALTGKGVHVVTVNDYLAKRDALWMAPLYEFLGLTVSFVVTNMKPEKRKIAYQADVTYVTNNELGFDYLRDNMAFHLEEKVLRELHYAIIDEVDSVLIDESRTPLIISGPVDDDASIYRQLNRLVSHFILQQSPDSPETGLPEIEDVKPADYVLDEKDKQINLTERGHTKLEKLLLKNNRLKEKESLYDIEHIALVQQMKTILRAHYLFKKDIDYIIKNNEIIIIDEHTGQYVRYHKGILFLSTYCFLIIISQVSYGHARSS